MGLIQRQSVVWPGVLGAWEVGVKGPRAERHDVHLQRR